MIWFLMQVIKYAESANVLCMYKVYMLLFLVIYTNVHLANYQTELCTV